MKVVVDCIVLIAANGRKTHIDADCSAKAARVLNEIIESHSLLDDTGTLVFSEYNRHCDGSGQQGPGDRFFKWYLQNRWGCSSVLNVNVGTTPADLLTHIPASLHGFDNDDHKWLALYKEGEADVLYEAGDSDYLTWSTQLVAEGFVVQSIC